MRKFKSTLKKIISVYLFLVFSTILTNIALAGETVNHTILNEEKKVLYISSYSPSFIAFFDQIEGIQKRFEDQPILLDMEFMDSRRFNMEENFQNFSTNLKFKLDNGLQYDAVILGDDNALNFFKRHKDEFFPETPLFFLGINNLEMAIESSKDPMITGVLEKNSIYETLEFARELMPSAKRVVGLMDNSVTSQGEFSSMMALTDRFPDLEFETIDMSTMTHEEFFDQVSSLQLTDIVLYLLALKDKNGAVKTYSEVHNTLVDKMVTPVYGLTTVGIGEGIFAGKVISHVDQGYVAADLVMRYFNGTPVESIPFVSESPNRYMIDYQLFEKYNFDKNKIPEDTIFINRNYTFVELYGGYIVLVAFVVFAESLIIFYLFRNIRERKRTEQRLLNSQHEVELINMDLRSTLSDLHHTNKELEDSILEINERDSRIREMIYVDQLTGLMTRYALDELLHGMLKDESKPTAIITLNIDSFKNLNDALGHLFGDKILLKVAGTLNELVEENIAISRFSGDEFIIVVQNYPDTNWIRGFLKKIHRLFEEMMIVDDTSLFLTVSIGVALFPEHASTPGELIKCADVALHEAKRSGKDTSKIYDEKMNINFYDRIQFQNHLRNAFNNNEFYLNYQPLVSVNPSGIYGFESLIRWNSKELGQVSPYKLITEAEEMGLIVKIGEWIIRESCKFAKMVNNNSDTVKFVSINISAVQLMFNGFFKKLTEIVEETGVKPECICLEMTETSLIENIDIGGNIIRDLRNYGFRIGLDDFGTGYSSLSYLKNFDIDVLKIDKSFIDHILLSSYDRYLVEAIIKIAKEKNINIVAEGVEQLSQYRILKGMHCSTIQGYFFSKPLSEEDALGFSDEDIADKIQL